MTNDQNLPFTKKSKLHTLKQLVENLYCSNQEFLDKNYPGITVKRILSELEYFLPCGYKDLDSFLNSLCFLENNSALQRFFNGLLKGVPLAYLSNKTFFFKSNFNITSEILIPRYETEILVEMAISEITKLKNINQKHLNIVDVGTGCGAIILSILRDLSANISILELSKHSVNAYAVDIAEEAVELSKTNFFSLSYYLNPNISFQALRSDRLSVFFKSTLKKSTEKFQIIVSNPPYIMYPSDLSNVHSQVRDFEPRLALFIADDEYWPWYNTFFEQAYQCLDDHGVMIMEGHESHLQQLSDLANKNKFTNVKIFKDYNQKDRFILMEKK